MKYSLERTKTVWR